ncbi:hypothetical protein HC028_11105 [Planosporangium flavigriseum]|uniref:Uncharacterized protein n=1 Tax=Planosporangium flavigriseum TaxID=373681 RepID=A0A8J3LDY2_9ACTN|nr:hypothetical protein [Planosporangium flavigriseum]NJC65048.1 hypothetical protein [Planosporangium flavigriseum]GIG71663.1 hypothetical protein Pfl04_00670 [Planosporangium flavigriseum]
MTSQRAYSDTEWGLLVGLPESVMMAAIFAESDNTNRTASESSAGLDAIAAGCDSGSNLVRDVATELVTRLGDPETGELPPMLEIGTREVDPNEVLTRARMVADVLAAKAGPGEAAAYRHWLVGIADQVVNAAKSGGFLGIGGSWVSESERRFVDELSTVLND